MHQIDLQQIHSYSKLELIAKQVVEGFITGLHKSPFHGFSVEFAEHRLYNTGESTKHIDWKLYGRTEKLFIKRYEEETNLRCQIIIDTSSSMHFPEIDFNADKFNKIKFSVYAAAALMNLLKKQRDAVGLSVFSDKLDIHSPTKSSSVHHKYLINELESLINSPKKNTKTSSINALHTIAETVHKRSLMVIFSDMMENVADDEQLFAALQHLKYNKHEVILFHTYDKKLELDFEFENRPYQFIDLETGEEIKVHPNDVKKNYIENMQKRKNMLKLKCLQFGIEFVEADVNQGFNSILQSYLIKRAKMM
ncbi:MAG: DUF58 domain-containing protein [Flavobacteriales bacterium]|nr:DUF58 domain-containing protein [Flavobacteriales bacterium]MCW8913227.1 DUF58 domain-containing protein [Flavobacteriales bacterium]MCW8936801.1 DUF58 domain-containing protein [Flavobacteriales bacterium]MCW8968641.1 DUF58 domain-containing protein [Flavobacteriales bacterium]MCW8989167.1 DUF58 domain-containing protein [Flavobacteriales bacterium]